MSKQAEHAALKAYPRMSIVSEPHGLIPADNKTHYLGDANEQSRNAFQQGYEQAEKELIPLINRLCESILFEWKDAADLAKKILVQIKEREEE